MPDGEYFRGETARWLAAAQRTKDQNERAALVLLATAYLELARSAEANLDAAPEVHRQRKKAVNGRLRYQARPARHISGERPSFRYARAPQGVLNRLCRRALDRLLASGHKDNRQC